MKTLDTIAVIVAMIGALAGASGAVLAASENNLGGFIWLYALCALNSFQMGIAIRRLCRAKRGPSRRFP